MEDEEGGEGEREGREEMKEKGEEREMRKMGKMKFHPRPHIPTPTHFPQSTSPLTPQASHR